MGAIPSTLQVTIGTSSSRGSGAVDGDAGQGRQALAQPARQSHLAEMGGGHALSPHVAESLSEPDHAQEVEGPGFQAVGILLVVDEAVRLDPRAAEAGGGDARPGATTRPPLPVGPSSALWPVKAMALTRQAPRRTGT